MKLLDLHCDTIEKLYERGEGLLENTTHFSVRDFPEFEGAVQTMAVYVPDTIRGRAARDFVDRYYHYLNQKTEEVKDRAQLAETGEDIGRIVSQGKWAFIRSIENASALNGDLDNIDYFAALNFKIIGLTWNGRNELGSGWDDPDQGLTDFGKRAVARMEEAGMIVDCSHLNDAGLEDLLETARKPFIATHSNLRSCCSHRRNLTDRFFQEIVKRKGLCGVNLCSWFLSLDEGSSSPDWVYRHIYHMLELGGEDCIAWGTDFDGGIIPPEGMDSPEGLMAFADYLLGRGISERVVEKLYYDNGMRFFKENLK